MKPLAFGFAAALVAGALTAPLVASAQRHGGGGGGGGGRGGARPAPAAPQRISAPPSRPAAPSGGFDLHEDIAPQHRSAPPPQRAVAPQHAAAPQRAGAPQHTNPGLAAGRLGGASHPGPQGHRPALVANLGYGGRPGNHRVVNDPRYHGGSWGWNHGETWNPAPRYYGGGFWGPFALGFAGVALFGSIAYDDLTLDSYQVEPDSPGAELLENYQLTQVPCGQDGLVVIFGPDNSVICADPNANVAAGEYQLDPADLTIVALDS